MPIELTTRELGLPLEKFHQWRPGQPEAMDRIMDAFQEYRYVCMSAPVGFGKTAVYIAVALAMGWRVCVVTASKGLQDQLTVDFRSIGMVDIRGRGNYPCDLAPGMTCEDGGHAKCGARKDEERSFPCGYKADYQRALRARLVVTNYRYWILQHKHGEGLGRFDLLVLDEAHDADKEVCEAMRVEFTARHVYRMLESRWPDNPIGCGIEQWRNWAKFQLPRAVQRLDALKAEFKHERTVPHWAVRDIASWSHLVADLTAIVNAKGAWASEHIDTPSGTGWALEPLWASEHTAGLLFLDVPHVMLVSATVRPKTLDLLGLPREAVDFQNYEYVFPLKSSPVYIIPTVRMKRDMDEADKALMVDRIDEIIGVRLDRKGLIHSVSYKFKEHLMSRCANSPVMMSHERNSDSTRYTIQSFRQMDPPALLVSPSISTGFDFPYEDAEYQIIPKLPWPYVKGETIMAARCDKKKGDPEYGQYLMVQALTQSIGRIMRAPDDRAETFILDSHILWARNELRHLFPSWVRRLTHIKNAPPAPPPSLWAERRAA